MEAGRNRFGYICSLFRIIQVFFIPSGKMQAKIVRGFNPICSGGERWGSNGAFSPLTFPPIGF
jgi:hypothetical protein